MIRKEWDLMVEVDVFWSYALGSSFALASFRQLRKIRADMGLDDSTFEIKDMLDVKKIIKEIEEKLSDLFVANLESSQEQVNEEIQRIIKTGDTEGQLKLMKIQELLEGLSRFYRGKPPQ